MLSIIDAIIDTLSSVILALAAMRVTGMVGLAAAGVLVAGVVATRMRRNKRS